MSDYARRSNPEGFAGACREVTISPQAEQQITDVRQLIRPDQMTTLESMGKANTTAGPDAVGNAKA